MLIKQLSYDIKELDEPKGIVLAYANVFDFKDADGDISAKGSFTKTIQENRKRIRVLKDHNPMISLGVPLMLDQDNTGLLTETKFNLQKEVSRDMFSDIMLMKEHGMNAELSIGYQVIKRNQKDISIIEEYKLMEYSFLTSWAANELSTVQSTKNIKSTYGIMDIIEKAYNLDYSDQRLRQIEKLLKSLSDEKPDSSTFQKKPITKDDLKKELLTIFN